MTDYLNIEGAKLLNRNAIRVDEFVNSESETFTDESGNSKQTTTGLIADFAETYGGSFSSGFTVNNRGQLFYYESGGHVTAYKWAGSPLALTVSAGSNPSSYGVIGVDWIDRTDVALRNELSSTDGAGLVGSMSYAQLRAYSGVNTTVNVWGISNIFDGAAGIFKVKTSDTTSADNGGTILVDTSGRRWYRVFSGEVNLKWFGAVGDGTTDDHTSIVSFFNYVQLSGCGGYIPDGIYKSGSNLNIDLSAHSTKGFVVRGAGMNRSIIDVTMVSSGVPFQICDSNGSTNSDIFYPKFRDFGITGNVNGPVAALGLHALTDALNAIEFMNIGVWNANNSSDLVAALEINGVYNSKIDVVCNCSGTSATYGDAIRIRQMQFSQLFCSAANANHGLSFNDGYNFGNTIISPDLEEVKYDVVIGNAKTTNNVFLGGQFSYTAGGISATAGANNVFHVPNFAQSTNRFPSKVGIAIYSQGNSAGTSYTPNQYVSTDTGDTTDSLNVLAGQTGHRYFRRADSLRWDVKMDNSSESGSNAGSNWVLTAYDDAGNSLGDVMYASRASRVLTVNKLSAQTVGFFGGGVVATRPTVTGAKSSNAALTSLIQQLAALGLITDSTT